VSVTSLVAMPVHNFYGGRSGCAPSTPYRSLLGGRGAFTL
jgi:hypothetical protein